MSPEWDPQWDADAEEPTPRPATKPGGWDAFWKDTQEANDAAMRKSGLDPSKCVLRARGRGARRRGAAAARHPTGQRHT